jgi:hypothetical protein
MSKFLKDELNVVQEVPTETLAALFPSFSQIPKEIQERSNKWILIASGKTEEGFEWQVSYQNILSADNLYYHLFIYNTEGALVGHVPIQAVQQVPPLPEKIHGIDYFDWLEIEGALFKWLVDHKYKAFQINMNPAGKMVYQTLEKPEEALEKMKKGEQYTIAAIKAEVFLEKIQEWKQQVAKQEEPTVTPEAVAKEHAVATKVVKPKKEKKISKRTIKIKKKTLP